MFFMAKDIGEYFVQEFVIMFGLLSGMGVDINGEMFKALGMSPILIFIIALFVMILSLVAAFAIGGWLGITAIGFAFIAGIFISTSFGAYMLVIGIAMGIIAVKIK